MSDEINDFLLGGSGGKAFDFGAIGDTVTGVITDMKKRQQTDFTTGAPLFWNDGNPKMMLQVTLQTDMQDGEDDEGLRNVYLRGGNFIPVKGQGASSLVAVKDSVKRSGAPEGIQVGGRLTLTYSGEAQPPTKGMNAAKLYTAKYEPPSFAVNLDELV